jgi:hypothetical protein
VRPSHGVLFAVTDRLKPAFDVLATDTSPASTKRSLRALREKSFRTDHEREVSTPGYESRTKTCEDEENGALER